MWRKSIEIAVIMQLNPKYKKGEINTKNRKKEGNAFADSFISGEKSKNTKGTWNSPSAKGNALIFSLSSLPFDNGVSLCSLCLPPQRLV